MDLVEYAHQNFKYSSSGVRAMDEQQAVEAVVLGTIVGKSTTREFSFQIENESKVFEYLKVYHRAFGDVLCQIMEITATRDDRIALCTIIGYRDQDGAIKSIRIPFDVGSRVLRADDEFIRNIIHLGDEHGALIGRLEGRTIPVSLDLRKILTKHVAVLAKSGAGKSYSVGVLIEEILERGVPLVIIDPHGEYSTLSQPNTAPEDTARLKSYALQPKSYTVNEYGDPTVTNGRSLKLSSKMTQQELVQMIPTKLTGTQIGILYSALRNIDQINFDTVIASLNAEESNAKWGLINILEHLRTYNIFSNEPTPYDEIVSPGTCSIINLRGIPAEIQSILVFKLTKDLFEMRKRGGLPPFFLVLEEAHNFCPERSFGETTASKTIRTIASEGRKFGLGLCVISQRPARLDKSVISQCTTQIILKVTNPNDLKAISSSVEGLTLEAEKEIANLPIGTALITGIVEVPLLVNVRPRKTLHGGHSVDIFTEIQAAKQPHKAPKAEPRPEPKQEPKVEPKPEPKPAPKAEPEKPKEMRPAQPIALLKPKKGIMEQLLKEKPLSTVQQTLIPAYLVTCTQGAETFRLVVSRVDGSIITNIETGTSKKLPDIKHLSKEELKVLQIAYTTPSAANAILGAPELHSLTEKGYLTVENDHVKLSDKFLFQKLSKVKSDDDLEMTRVTDATMLEPVLSENEVRLLLAAFVSVKQAIECYVLKIQVK
jgi:uncharacterized protein